MNRSLLDDPVKLIQAKAQIDTMMQQLDPTRNSYQKLEFFKICVRTILAQMGQITLTYLNILRRRPEAVEACRCMYLVRAQTTYKLNRLGLFGNTGLDGFTYSSVAEVSSLVSNMLAGPDTKPAAT